MNLNLKTLKTVAIVLGVVIVLLTALLVGLILHTRRHVLDGPGMVYDFRDAELGGTWTQVGDRGTLRFTRTHVSWRGVWGESGRAAYTVDDTGLPPADAEVYIRFPDYDGPFESMIWHRETADGQDFGVLSGVIFEYDGRGEVVFDEFLREEDGARVPDGWSSAVAHRRNDRAPIPSWAEALPAERADGLDSGNIIVVSIRNGITRKGVEK